MLDQFRLIKNLPALNNVNRTLAKTPLKFFTEFVERNIFDAVVNNSAQDYLVRFYGEFISCSSGDGQSLGVVLTSRHITELFCASVDLKPDDAKRKHITDEQITVPKKFARELAEADNRTAVQKAENPIKKLRSRQALSIKEVSDVLGYNGSKLVQRHKTTCAAARSADCQGNSIRVRINDFCSPCEGLFLLQ